MGVALFLGGLATDATEVVSGPYAPVNELVGAVAVVVLWWRRRAPLAVAAVTFAAAAVAPMAGGAAIVGVYSVVAHHRMRASFLVGGLYVAYLASAAVVGLVLFPDEDLGATGSVLAAVVMAVAAYGWGLATRSRRELLVALAERAERAEADQHARLAEARRAERVHIAAEMHDVLAHRLSLLSLHAGAMELRPDAPQDDLAAAAAVVRSNAHLALDDLRAVIGVLRDDTGGDLAPPATLADVDALIAECRRAHTRVEVVDTLPAEPVMPPELARHIYQVVREGLTNARKHAPGQPVRLALTGGKGDGLRIEIVNSLAEPVPASAQIPGAGVGLIGLRERVELAGGWLTCGADAATYRVDGWLPWTT